MAEQIPALKLTHFMIGRDLDDPSRVVVRLSADKVKGPHLDFSANAPLLDHLAAAFKEAANSIRKRAN